MSDDRFTREPGDDDEPHVPTADRAHIDPKPRTWYNKAPAAAFDLAAEVPKFLDKYCAMFGIKPSAKAKKKADEAQPAAAEQKPIPSAEDWARLAEEKARE